MARALLAMSAAALLALAPAAGATEPPYGGALSLQVENDFFAALTNSDEHYTNGLRLEFIDPPLAPTAPARDWPVWRLLDWGGDSDARYRQIGVTLGQSLFAPDDTDRADRIADDRPYAGWL